LKIRFLGGVDKLSRAPGFDVELEGTAATCFGCYADFAALHADELAGDEEA
jgi:hypothetical protein